MEMDNNEDKWDHNLKSINTEGGFKIPFGYFEQLPKHVLRQTIGEQEESKRVPRTYFTEARNTILNKTVGVSNHALKVWYRKPLVQWAAALLILAMGVIFWLSPSRILTSQTSLLSDEEVFFYLEQTDNRDIPDEEWNNLNKDNWLTESEQEMIMETEEQLIIDEL